jgi:hypothetical protein
MIYICDRRSPLIGSQANETAFQMGAAGVTCAGNSGSAD